jgi:thiamine kinase-like enzyme
MEQFEKIYEHIKSFVSKKFSSQDYNELEITFEKMNGLSNSIYLVRIFNKTTKEFLDEFVYRLFGEISEFIDRDLELDIIQNLSVKGVTPFIYETDYKSYRIEEYIGKADVLPREILKEEDIIQRVMQILISYTLISGVFHYKVSSENFTDDYHINIDPEVHSSGSINKQRIKQNIFDMCIKKFLDKARKNFDKFSNKFQKKYNKFNKFLDVELVEKFEKLKYFINNYNTLFMKIFPKHGLLTLNHNDVHRLNILLTDSKEKLLLLDHEYAALNLLGIDIVNYLIETSYDYTIKKYPFQEFNPGAIDLEAFFEVFKSFICKLELAHASVFAEEENRKKLEKVKTFKYFLKLVCLISLFWLLFTVIYLDYESFTLRKTFDYFEHAITRINIFQQAYNKLSQIKDPFAGDEQLSPSRLGISNLDF